MSDFAQELAAQIPRLRRYARALTRNAAWADDLVQDTLERAWRQRWRFTMGSNAGAWLFTILYRLYLNDAARPERRLSVPETGQDAAAWPNDGLRLDIARALDALGPEHRAVIVLVGLEQLSYREAAEVLGVPPGTVMSRLARAREQLRLALEGRPAAGGRTADESGIHLTRIK